MYFPLRMPVSPFLFSAMWKYGYYLLELFGGKIKALIERGAARDLYDTYNMIKNRLFATQEERCSLRKIVIFYLTVGASRPTEASTIDFADFPEIEKIRFPQIRAQLLPVLRQNDKFFDFERTKSEAKLFLQELLQLSEKEKQYIAAFHKGEYRPELLFDNPEIIERIKFHPMALWKTRAK